MEPRSKETTMMARTRKQTTTKTTPGFAIELKPDTDLGLAMLNQKRRSPGFAGVAVGV
jgi:hypothetical protein